MAIQVDFYVDSSGKKHYRRYLKVYVIEEKIYSGCKGILLSDYHLEAFEKSGIGLKPHFLNSHAESPIPLFESLEEYNSYFENLQ